MKNGNNRVVLDFSNHWILLGITLSILGFLPIALHGAIQTIIMGVLGLFCIGMGIHGKRCKSKIEKILDEKHKN